MKTYISQSGKSQKIFCNSGHLLCGRSMGSFIFVFLAFLFWNIRVQASELNIGTASADITPDLPVSLSGQFHLRIADTIETPLTANVIALESFDQGHSAVAAIMVSCDLVGIPGEVLKNVRDEVFRQLPGFDVSRIIMNATHTHTAPVMENSLKSSFRYNIPAKGVLQAEEYNAFFVKRVADAVVKAWKSRKPGSVSWGISHAAVAYNRRAVYADGTAQMYGKTNVPEFINLEGMEDHDVNTLFFWDKAGKLMAVAINVPCPAQEVEMRSAVNADYWHPVREKLKQRFGQDLCVLGWIGAAGDQSPRPIYRRAAEERMIRLRNLDRLEEIARRIVAAVEESYETVKADRYEDIIMVHRVEQIDLPERLVTEDEYNAAKEVRDRVAAQMVADSSSADRLLAQMTWNNDVVQRFEKQKIFTKPVIQAEIHVLRLGDIVVCTNEFELFTDYGIRIQARSNALQTFIIQLTTGSGGIHMGTYLPSEKAEKGGGYSAVIQSCVVGHEGGQILVDRTVKMIDGMWE